MDESYIPAINLDQLGIYPTPLLRIHEADLIRIVAERKNRRTAQLVGGGLGVLIAWTAVGALALLGPATPPRIIGSSYVWLGVAATLACIVAVVMMPMFENIRFRIAPRQLARVQRELCGRGESRRDHPART